MTFFFIIIVIIIISIINMTIAIMITFTMTSGQVHVIAVSSLGFWRLHVGPAT